MRISSYIAETMAKEASQALGSHAKIVRENVSFPDFPCGTGLSRSAFSSCHLSCQKLSSSHFSVYPSISRPPSSHPSAAVLSFIHLCLSHSPRNLDKNARKIARSRERTRLSSKSIVYRGFNPKIQAQTVKILYLS